MRSPLVICLIALTGCTQFPALEDVESAEVKDAAYPRLMTAAELRQIPESQISVEIQGAVLDRVAALRARAARLQRPVIDRATRQRMARGVR